jgi:hypothetical protein
VRGYSSNVSAIDPTANGRGSTISAAPWARGRPRVDDLGRAVGARRDHRGAVLHLTVRERRAVLDAEHPLALDANAVLLDLDRRRREHDLGVRVVLPDRGEHRFEPFLRRAVDLVDDADVGQPQVRLAGVVPQFVPRSMGVDDRQVQRRPYEGRVVVAAVPEDHVGLALGRAEDRLVVDAGEDEVALGEVRLVLLALLDRAVGRVEVLVALEPLHRLPCEVAVGHGVAEDGDAPPRVVQERGDPSRRLALPRARANGADRDDRLRRGQHRLGGREQPERRARGQRP